MKPGKWLALLALASLLAAIAIWCHQLLALPMPRAGRAPVPVLHNTMRPSHAPKSVHPVDSFKVPTRGK